METVHATIYCVIYVYLLANVGNWACRQMFRLTGLTTGAGAEATADQRAGSTCCR